MEEIELCELWSVKISFSSLMIILSFLDSKGSSRIGIQRICFVISENSEKALPFHSSQEWTFEFMNEGGE